MFSTFDKDNDGSRLYSCARLHKVGSNFSLMFSISIQVSDIQVPMSLSREVSGTTDVAVRTLTECIGERDCLYTTGRIYSGTTGNATSEALKL